MRLAKTCAAFKCFKISVFLEYDQECPFRSLLKSMLPQWRQVLLSTWTTVDFYSLIHSRCGEQSLLLVKKLIAYYWAANVRCLTFWSYLHNQPDCPSWVTVEFSAKNVSIPTPLGSSLPLPPNKLTGNPVVWHALRVKPSSGDILAFLLFASRDPLLPIIFFNLPY